MKAIVISQFGPPSVLTITDLPTPTPHPGEVLIKIAAFGINHAEMHMRKGEWAEWMPVSGIECVGTVAACPAGEFTPGIRVASLMGGLGRTVNGSYAEYTVARASNVVPLGPGAEKLMGRGCWFAGGTSAFGRAAINLAVQKGVHVTATTRNEGRIPGLKALGVEGVEIETPRLSERLSTKFDAILDLIGNSTIVDSLKMVHRGGRVCLAGFLGGLAPVPDFNPLLQMASGVHFSFFGSFVFGTPEFPLSDVPLQEIVEIVAEGKFEAEPSRVFMFEEIQEAHRLMDANQANGKMVVVVD